MKKIKEYLTRKRDIKLALSIVAEAQKTSDTHLIALARLAFIKPAQLVREAQNNKDNAEYLLKMTNELQKKNEKQTK